MSGARLAFLCAAGALAANGVLAPLAAAAWSPAVNYALNCQGCHLADGRETAGLVPPLAGSVGRLVRVPEGRAYLVRLPNVAAIPLDDAEIAELLNWVVETFGAAELPPDFAPFTAHEVGRGRGSPIVDIDGERRAVLEALARAEARPRDAAAR